MLLKKLKLRIDQFIFDYVIQIFSKYNLFSVNSVHVFQIRICIEDIKLNINKLKINIKKLSYIYIYVNIKNKMFFERAFIPSLLMY